MRIRGCWISPHWIRLLVLGAVVIGVIWVVVSQTKIHFNRTESAPYHAFVCIHGLNAGLGNYISIEGHPTEYFSGKHFTKRVAGLPGDVIEFKDGNMFAGNRLIGPLLAETTQGLKLTPMPTSKVPEGFVFVVGDHSHSFDSRYQEFGLVKTEDIKGRCFGLGKRKAEQL
jgi:conjugal transfer pilin signal peptidase TrbI